MLKRIALEVPVGDATWPGIFAMPALPMGLIVLVGLPEAEGRDRGLAALFQRQGFATLVLNMAGASASDAILGERLARALDVIVARDLHHGLPMGLSAGETASAAALIAAARRPAVVKAVALLGARVDPALEELASVRAPTLLVVGSSDLALVRSMREAGRVLLAKHEVALISGARHQLDQPGVLEETAVLCGRWFSRHFVADALRPRYATL